MPKCTDPFPFGECQICQDKATGIHYGVAACQGCKGFYKRTILRNVKYVCYTGGNCPLNPQTRSRCKACRYRRCVETGMSMGSIKMGRIPKAQKKLALANLHSMTKESNGSDQCQDGMNEESSEIKQDGDTTGSLPNLTKVGEELDKLESTSSASQKPIENFVPLHSDRSALNRHRHHPSDLVPPSREETQTEHEESQSLCHEVNAMKEKISKLIDDKCPNVWAKVSNGTADTHSMGDNIRQSASFQARSIPKVQTESTSTDQCLDIMSKVPSPVHFSSEVITELIHQVRQQPSSNRTIHLLNQLFANVHHGLHPACTSNQQIQRPLQPTRIEMVHSTTTKLMVIETGLESDVLTMNAEIAGTVKPHRLNMLEEATREDARIIWDALFESIPICTDKIIKFCRQFPGMSVLGSSQMDLLIRKGYFEIWILQYSDLFSHGDFYLRLPGGARYSIWWMNLILPKEVVDGMVHICSTLEYYKVPQLLRRIMCAIILFDSSAQDSDADNIDTLHAHYLDVLGEAVRNEYGADDNRIILEIFKLMSSLKHCAKKMASAVGDYNTGELPDPCIQYLSKKTTEVLEITSAGDDEEEV